LHHAQLGPPDADEEAESGETSAKAGDEFSAETPYPQGMRKRSLDPSGEANNTARKGSRKRM